MLHRPANSQLLACQVKNMSNSRCNELFAISIAIAALGCGPDTLTASSTGQTVGSQNQLSYNRLVYNRLVYNNLAKNQLAESRLSSSELLYNSIDGLEETAEGRELLTYIARCSLSSGDSLVVEHDGETYMMPGLLGLAPEWEDESLSGNQANLISACLLAHVNAFGVSVEISLRSPGVLGAPWWERQSHPVHEATFFGDVFGGQLRTFSCLGSEYEIAAAHSSARVWRGMRRQDLGVRDRGAGVLPRRMRDVGRGPWLDRLLGRRREVRRDHEYISGPRWRTPGIQWLPLVLGAG